MSGLVLAMAMSAQARDCVPLRWGGAMKLELLTSTPVNCLLVEEPDFAAPFVAEARARGLKVFGVVRDTRAMVDGLDGVVRVVDRARLDFNADVVATDQGLWAGVRAEKDGKLEARPTSGPWIETNTGYLRYARAASGAASVLWMAHRAPAGPQRWTRYSQAVSDAALGGARWAIDLSAADWESLAKGDEAAVAGWRRLMDLVRFYEQTRALWTMAETGGLAVVADAETGGLVSGGIVDMITAKHIPVSVLPPASLGKVAPRGVRMLLNIDPARLNDSQREAVRAVARGGATLVNGPPGWKMTLPPEGRITYSDAQVKQLDEIWREINSIIGRKNFAVRVFGAPGMLSSLKGGAQLALQMVNYTDYAVENITLHFAEKVARAELWTPKGRRALEVYEADGESAVDIDRIEDAGFVVLEEAQPKR